MRYLCLLLLTTSLLSAGSASGAERQSATDNRLVFIHLNDLHANLTPHRDLVREVDEDGAVSTHIEQRGGLARIATLIGQIRSREPNAILMNIGDTYHGGVEALYTRGNAVVAPVNALNIDIGVPGNWDFAYGPVVTRMRYQPQPGLIIRWLNQLMSGEPVTGPDYPQLGGNVSTSIPLLDSDEPLLPATKMMAVHGRNIGFIGITSDIIPRMSAMLSLGFEFLQGEQAYRSYINHHAQALREQGADLVVVMSELGLHKDWQLAQGIDPGVDIIFSAHTHEVTTEPLLTNSGALVVEAGNDGLLGTMTVTFTNDEAKRFEWDLLEVHSAIPPDLEVAALVSQARAPFLSTNPDLVYAMPGSDMRLTQSIEQEIGDVPFTLHRRHALENPFNRFLADSIRSYYQTDIAITPGFRFDAVIPAGQAMTIEDSYRYLPVPPVLARGVITGKDLLSLIEFELNRIFSPDAFDHSGGWLMGLSGIDLTLDLEAANNHRVLEMRRASDGSAIALGDKLSAVSCLRPFDDSDALCGNKGFSDIEELQSPAGSQWTARDFLYWRIEQGAAPTPLQQHIKDVAGTAMWPESPYVQPLQGEPAGSGTTLH